MNKKANYACQYRRENHRRARRRRGKLNVDVSVSRGLSVSARRYRPSPLGAPEKRDRHQFPPRQELGRRLPSADPGRRRHRAARHAAGTRIPRRLCRGRQIRTLGRRRVLLLAGGELAGNILRRQILRELGARARHRGVLPRQGRYRGARRARNRRAEQPIELRVEAAKAAIGYEKPRLAAVDAKHTGTITLEELIHMSYEGKQAKEEDQQQQAP
jgi:hypothetical protein